MKILIMAGGSGERFWPLSTKKRPKQILPLITGKPMIRETVDRVLKMLQPKDIYIATNEIQSEVIIDELYEIPKSNIIIEPMFKDTAAAIAYGSMIITRDCFEDPIIGVLASDHLIEDVSNFIDILKLAELEAKKGSIVTLGIKPTKPETGYGYILLSETELEKPTKAIRFMEKPNYDTAIQYLEQGNYVWNSGMFIFKNEVMMKEINKYLPNHYAIINEMSSLIKDYNGIKLASITKSLFAKFERISIDFAVMEKSNRIKCIPVDFGWNDVGGFGSLEEIFDKDDFGNIIKGADYVQIDSRNNIIITNKPNRLITSISINNKIVVDTDEALLICDKSEAQRIKELLKKIV